MSDFRRFCIAMVCAQFALTMLHWVESGHFILGAGLYVKTLLISAWAGVCTVAFTKGRAA